VFSGLSKKIVKNHISNEVKKQLLSSKRLKGYFEEHQTERDAIEKSIAEEVEKNSLSKHLAVIPEYCMPQAIIINPAEIESGNKRIKVTDDQYMLPTSNISLIKNVHCPPVPLSEKKDYKFAYEDPKILNAEKLAFTSGRKIWKLKHKKRVKKGLRKDKKGYIGS